MDYEFVSDEAKPVALALERFLNKIYRKTFIGTAAWDNAPYRTTFFTRESETTKLFEVQERPHFGGIFRGFSQWLAAQRHCAELSVVVAHDAPATASLISELRSNNIGLLVLDDDGKFRQEFLPRNPALIVTPEPSLRYGDMRAEAIACIEKFNDGGRKDGLRDMCELVEGETKKVLIRASRRGLCTVPEADILKMDLSGHINTLASEKATAAGKTPPCDDKLKGDLHSFRGARNLLDHPVESKREEARRQRQFSERMMMGPRLVAELVAIRRKIG